MSRVGEAVGRVGGWVLAPVTAAVAAARRSRVFHPDGVVFEVAVEPIAEDPDLWRLAKRLEGTGIARLSSALWKGEKEWIDNLGFALRFGDDQDLLFATIRSPWTTVLAALRTKVHDFLANDYYAVSPFRVDGIGRVRWRLVSERPWTNGGTRLEKLLTAVNAGAARFDLEAKRKGRAYESVARVTLLRELQLDQSELRFNPFRNGRGIVPASFVHKLRVGAYAGSQRTRERLRQTPTRSGRASRSARRCRQQSFVR